MQLLLYNSDYKLNTLKKIEYGLNSNVKDGYWMQFVTLGSHIQ